MITNSSYSNDSSIVDLSSTLNRSTCVPKYRIPFPSSARPNGKNRSSTPNNSTTKSLRSFTIMTLMEGRSSKKGLLGIASMDVRYPDVDLYEFLDSNAYTRLKSKIQVEDPVEIVIADSITEKPATVLLIEVIKTAFPSVTITTVHKRYFNHARGADLIEQLANKEVSNCDAIVLKKQFCLAACAALLKYIEQIQNVMFSAGSLRVRYMDAEKICMLDIKSWANLEISNEIGGKKKTDSLLSVVDQTLTAGGARLLRSNLLQPSADQKLIESRLDAVQELLEDEHLLERLRQILSRVHELDHVLSVCVYSNKEMTVQAAESCIMQLLRLQQTLQLVNPLRSAMDNVKSKLLLTKKKFLDDERIDAIIQLLDEKLDISVLATNKKTSITIKNQRCYAVKEGLSVNLDVARKAYEELLRDLQTQEKELETHLPRENTRLAYSATRGFHYAWVCQAPTFAKLPSIFINEVRNRSSITFTSRSLIRYNDRIEQSVCEVLLASASVVTEIIDQIRPLAAVLYYLIDLITSSDYLCSLAVYASNTHVVRPRFGSNIVLKAGRHPVLDNSIPDTVVANDTYLTVDTRLAIITGPNMAGKSTYLKQVCQLAVLAQTGSFIPAKLAVLPVFTRIFCRVGHNDDLSQNLSAFALEMSEMSVILQYADSHSLVVIDELARSTSTEEGIGISHAMAEKLLKLGPYTFLATHFLDLASLDVNYAAVENFHFSPQLCQNEEGEEVMQASHTLFKGPYTGPLYGFELVSLSTFPEEVTRNAREMALQLRAESENKRMMDGSTLRRRALIRTAHRLRQAVAMSKTSSRESTIKYLKDLRKHFISMMNEADEEDQNEEDDEKEGDGDENH